MLDRLSSDVPIVPENYFSWKGVDYVIKRSLLSDYCVGIVEKSQGKYHLVKIVNDGLPNILLLLIVRIIALMTLIPFLIGAMVEYFRPETSDIYYFNREKKPDYDRSYFIDLAYSDNSLEEMKVLYALNSNVILEENRSKHTAFDMACERGCIELIKWLYSLKPELISHPDDGGLTPFSRASVGKRVDVIKCLFELDHNILLEKIHFRSWGDIDTLDFLMSGKEEDGMVDCVDWLCKNGGEELIKLWVNKNERNKKMGSEHKIAKRLLDGVHDVDNARV